MMDVKRHATDDADIINKVAGQTKRGKKLKVGQYASGYFYITFVDGGKLPKTLLGRYTNYTLAQQDIDLYLSGR